MKIEFTKATASGNDFVIIDSRNKIFDFNYNNFVKIACNRKFGIGADGVIFIEKDIDCSQTDIYDKLYFLDKIRQDYFSGNIKMSAYLYDDIIEVKFYWH